MITERIDLYDYFKLARNGATGGYLTVYARTPSNELKPKLRPAALIFPGGCYQFLSDREGEPVALAFLGKGYVSFIMNYSVNASYPVPLHESLMAVAYVRENAERYSVNRDKVVTVGFSAGGHLAGLLATATKTEIESLPIKTPALPDATILSYPVVTMGEYTHECSRSVISNGGKIPYDLLSVDKRVTNESVPAFIWHTTEDVDVPMENSLLLVRAYRRAGVPFSYMVFERGWHGLSLCNEETNDQKECDIRVSAVSKWFELALDWLSARGFQVVNEFQKYRNENKF